MFYETSSSPLAHTLQSAKIRRPKSWLTQFAAPRTRSVFAYLARHLHYHYHHHRHHYHPCHHHRSLLHHHLHHHLIHNPNYYHHLYYHRGRPNIDALHLSIFYFILLVFVNCFRTQCCLFTHGHLTIVTAAQRMDKYDEAEVADYLGIVDVVIVNFGLHYDAANTPVYKFSKIVASLTLQLARWPHCTPFTHDTKANLHTNVTLDANATHVDPDTHSTLAAYDTFAAPLPIVLSTACI